MVKRVLIVFGTRPEAIKMYPVWQTLKQKPEYFDTQVCVTAQHREMLDQVLDIFEIKPDFDLNLMKSGQDLFDITSAVLLGMRKVLDTINPDIVMVHGDTTTSFASGLACFYRNIPVWHVEAGLRTYNTRAPFPEEFNRQSVTKISDVHLAPTLVSKNNLLAEGIDEKSVIVTGNTVIDALFAVLKQLGSNDEKRARITKIISGHLSFDWQRERFVLITGHRRENFGEGFRQICRGLRELALSYPSTGFVYPVHLNPNVQAPVNDYLKGIPNVFLIPPLEYESFVYLLKHCYLVITDSGGIQEEAPSLGKPVLVLRNTTERPEAVTAGTVVLVGACRDKLVENTSRLLDDGNAYSKMSTAHNPYGDGRASDRIFSALMRS